jgi:protease IV
MTVVSVFLIVVVFALFAALISVFGNSEDEGSGWLSILDHGGKIGVITIEDTILRSDGVLKQLRKFRKKSSIKAIVIRINSPGGTVAPAQEIYREIQKVRTKKPVVASIETVGASAAYYIASATDHVVCSKGSITGSIGVIMMLADLHKVIEKLGVGVNVIKAGKYKDIGSGVRPLTEEERSILESFAAQIHEQFITDVAAGRKGKITMDQLRAVADGRFFTGEKAKELGLVDSIGNFYDAVKQAASMAGVKEEPQLVYPEKKWDSYLDVFLESMSDAASRVLMRTRALDLAPEIR